MDIRTIKERTIEFFHLRLKQLQLPNWWRDSLLVTTNADERFDILPQIAAHNHMLPRDLLDSCRSVIIFFIPFTKELSNGNIDGKFPSDEWGLSLSLTNDLIQDISEFISDTLKQSGYISELTPATYNFNAETLMARWSHKHLAHLGGLGRFGINAQLITPAGCAGRLGSLLTEAALGNHPLVEKRELCLHKIGKDCLKCLETCPVKAISLKGIDRHRCDRRLQVLALIYIRIVLKSPG